MANVLTNYFAIKKPGSAVGQLKAKKSSASVTSVRKSSSVSSSPKICDVAATGDGILSKTLSTAKVRSLSLSSKEDKTNAVVDNGCVLPAVKSRVKQNQEVGIERIKSPRKRKISNDNQEVKNDNPPTKLIKLTTKVSTKDSESRPQGSCSNGKILDNTIQNMSTTISTNTRLKLLKPENIEKLQQLKKNLNIIKKTELAKPVLRQEKYVTLISKTSSVSSKTETSEEAAIQNGPKVPAYQRFHALALKDVAVSLVLPYKFKFLAEGFRCLDTVISLIYNRHEICPFAKIKPAVEDMMRRKFDLLNLGQIKTVFPTAYFFQQEKLRVNRSFSMESQLTIIPNMNCFSTGEESGSRIKEETKPYTIIRDKNDNSGKNGRIDNCSQPNGSKLQQPDKMKPSFLIARRDAFHSRLLQIMERFHNDFLATLKPPIILGAEETITRWHPKFVIDSVPDITPSELPKPAEAQICASAIDVLHKIRRLYNRKVDDASELVSNNCTTMETSTNETQAKQPSPLVTSKPTIKGIPEALREKIRAKEAAKTKAFMTRNPETDIKLQMLSRLPDMARILRNLFISEKKAAISISDASSKIFESYIGSVNPVDMDKHLYLLKELAPDWLTILSIRQCVYLKLNKTMSFCDVLTKIENAKKVATLP